MKKSIKIIMLLLIVLPSWAIGQERQERPNILCLVLEDTSQYQFGCYGNKDVKTPTIDALAERGILYTNSSSNAPHCSVARSTLITGSYATTYGMDIHRENYITPSDIFYPELLRKAGYFCTNNQKTDYNTTVDNKAMWDECNIEATYSSDKRKPGQPFFAIFNALATHMGLVRTITTEGRPDFKNSGIDADKIFLPPHVPDLPEVRSDMAYHLKSMQDADNWVKAFLNDLKAKGLSENTIVFFFSDHGGTLPRGKGFPFESGLRIPLVVYVPPAWQDQFNVTENTVENRNVSFVDFAPTFLSLTGTKPPAFMQGKAFLGPYAEAPAKLQYGFRSNQENYHYDPSRTVTDGKLKYIRNYIPHKPFQLRNLYQWGMPSNQAWDEYVMSGECKNEDWIRPYKPKKSEMLFDLEKDLWELNNLADDPRYKENLTYFRSRLSKHVRETKDLGFFPREMRISKKNGLYQWVRDTNFDLEALFEASELAGIATNKDVPELLRLLQSPYPEIRYWGAVGFCTLGSRQKLDYLPRVLRNAMKDESPEVASMAAEAACYLGGFDKGADLLVTMFKNNFDPAYSSLETLTWYPQQKKMLKKYASEFLQLESGQNVTMQDRMGIGLKLRSILVNLDELSIRDLYTEADILDGIKKNKVGRKFIYPPNGH